MTVESAGRLDDHGCACRAHHGGELIGVDETGAEVGVPVSA